MTSQESEGRRLHAEALAAQEKGDFLAALLKIDEAMLAYEFNGDSLGLAESQAMRFLTLKHLYEKTNDKAFLIIAKYTVMASVELAKLNNNKDALSIPLFNLAKVQELLGEYGDAVISFRQALETVPNRPAVIADFKVHLATCEYKTGDKSALDRAEEAVAELEKAREEDTYSKNVWLSGGHMRIADAVNAENKELARKHMGEAKKIIDSDERLKLRLEQWTKQAEKLGVA